MDSEMKIAKKPIESVRIRKDRGEKLKAIAVGLTVKTKEHVTEADIVNFLIDKCAQNVDAEGDKLILDI